MPSIGVHDFSEGLSNSNTACLCSNLLKVRHTQLCTGARLLGLMLKRRKTPRFW